MSVKKFTEAEQQVLAQNPFTISVTATNLYTSKEFKEKFLQRYLIGDKSPRQIVSELGYDPEILGFNRITGIHHHIMGKYKAGEPLEDGGYRQRIKGRQAVILHQTELESGNHDAVKQLRAEVSYLRQEVAFLKKLMQNETGKRSEK